MNLKSLEAKMKTIREELERKHQLHAKLEREFEEQGLDRASDFFAETYGELLSDFSPEYSRLRRQYCFESIARLFEKV